MRVVRFVLGGLVGLAVLIGGGVLVYVLTRPRPSTVSVIPPAPNVPLQPDITKRGEKPITLGDETPQEIPDDGAIQGGRPPKARDSRLDLNTATIAELEALPRIGPSLAKRIVIYRQDYGDFTTVADLQKVNGIGPSVIGAIKDLVRV